VEVRGVRIAAGVVNESCGVGAGVRAARDRRSASADNSAGSIAVHQVVLDNGGVTHNHNTINNNIVINSGNASTGNGASTSEPAGRTNRASVAQHNTAVLAVGNEIIHHCPNVNFVPGMNAPATTLVHYDVAANDVAGEHRVSPVLTRIIGSRIGVVVVDEVSIGNIVAERWCSGVAYGFRIEQDHS
jgi:hypothetical protein